MPELSVVVNGRTYEIVCGEGQEDHVAALADDIDRRVEDLVSVLGQAGEGRLLLMAGLLISDELAEIRAELDAHRQQRGTAGEGGFDPNVPAGNQPVVAVNESKAIEAIACAFSDIDELAGRIEAVAQRLRCL